YNAVFINGDAVGSTMFYGLGAGMMATASAVVADIMDIARDISSGVPASHSSLGFAEGATAEVVIKDIEELEMPYYLRFTAVDEPGVLSKISGVFGAHNISIASVIQEERNAGETVPLVIVTHVANEQELKRALAEITGLDITSGAAVIIRIEESLSGGE
ncbi:MAG: ACT domain-containing protein, partial [Thermodesulfobacteriota bacterium]